MFKRITDAVAVLTGKKTVKKSSSQLADFLVETEGNSDSLDQKFLFDFRNLEAGAQISWNTASEGVITGSRDRVISVPVTGDGQIIAGAMHPDDIDFILSPVLQESKKEEEPEEAKEAKKLILPLTPKQALAELEVVPTPWSLIGLEAKIAMVKAKQKLVTQHYTKREINGLLERLENRKKYAKHKAFADMFQNTTDEKIEKFLKKHKHLVMKTSDIFIPEFPDEAINRMTEYSKMCQDLCGKEPVYYVIAKESDFKKAVKKRDPILLVQSPFGFYWQILGAWDEEMLYLGDL